MSAARKLYNNVDCHYGDHSWHGGGVCVRCGDRLRCCCGAFVTEDGIETHLQTCRIVLKALAAPSSTGREDG